ncbi:hypothetical protein AVEN_235337-2, partial [Araneus ventricosus]
MPHSSKPTIGIFTGNRAILCGLKVFHLRAFVPHSYPKEATLKEQSNGERETVVFLFFKYFALEACVRFSSRQPRHACPLAAWIGALSTMPVGTTTV